MACCSIPAIDTAAAYSDGSVTGCVAKAGSFRGPALIVPTGVDAGLISVALRGRGIYVEGPSPFLPRLPFSPRNLSRERQRNRIGVHVQSSGATQGQSGLRKSVLPGRRGGPR